MPTCTVYSLVDVIKGSTPSTFLLNAPIPVLLYSYKSNGYEYVRSVGGDGLEELLDEVEDVSINDAFLVDSTVSEVSSGAGGTNAESPAGLVDLLTTLGCALLHLIRTSTCILALVVLVSTSLVEALLEFRAHSDAAHDGEEA